MGKRGFFFVVAAAVCLAAPLSSCLDATEIVIQLSTDVPCPTVGTNQVIVHIGSPSNIADNPPTHLESAACTPGDATMSNDMGNIVVLPSGGFDSIVSISVALSNDVATPTSSCFPESQGASCIYAHRQISFLPHARVTLPIVLSSVCAGVQCKAPLTCNPNSGKCESGDIDPHDSGLLDVSVDVPVTIDAPADVGPEATTCSANETMCNGKCVNILSNNANCGACGFDCTNGTCTNGTCRLDVVPDSATSTFTGTCIALYNSAVWVSTANGVAKLGLNGGSPTYASSVKAYTLASYAGELARIESGTQTTIVDAVSANTYGQGNSGIAELMAMSPKGYVWSDYSKSNVWVQSSSGGAPTSYTTFPQGTIVPVAMASDNVYWTLPASGVYWSTGTSSGSATVGQPGAVIVNDAKSTTPTVYAVVKANQLVQFDYKLTTMTNVATSSLSQLGALAYDGTTVYAIGATAIEKVQGTSMVTVTKVTSPDLRCLAVDGGAVYWLGSGAGVFKHVK